MRQQMCKPVGDCRLNLNQIVPGNNLIYLNQRSHDSTEEKDQLWMETFITVFPVARCCLRPSKGKGRSSSKTYPNSYLMRRKYQSPLTRSSPIYGQVSLSRLGSCKQGSLQSPDYLVDSQLRTILVASVHKGLYVVIAHGI